MNMVKVRDCVLGGVPRIAAIVDRTVDPDEVVGYAGRGATLLEIRADLFGCSFSELVDYVRLLRERTPLPMIGTLRETDTNRGQRLDMLGQLCPLVDSVDIEIDAPIAREVAAMCAGKPVIVSVHDFQKTPDREGLERICSTALSLGAAVVKVATMAHRASDVTRLLRFCEESAVPTVAIAMGPVGTISRVVAPMFGSLFTYACVGKEVAPGQIPLDELAGMMRLLYPGFPDAS